MLNLIRLWIVLYIALGPLLGPFGAAVADAACSGAGLTWSCTAGSTGPQIQAAVDGASNEAVVTMANGTYSASDIELSGRNGITVICETVSGCTMTATATVFFITGCPADRTNLMRISGFKYTGNAGINNWIYCADDITKLRIDHNECDNIGEGNLCFFVGEGGDDEPLVDRGNVFGVMDHNNCHGSQSFLCLKNTSGGMIWATGRQGTADNFFFEDNVCDFTSQTSHGTGCLDNWRAQSNVARFNTVTNAVLRAHSYCHGGPSSMELYGNLIVTSDGANPGYRNIHHQGSGEIMIWGNDLGPTGNTPLVIQHYRVTVSSLPQGACSAGQAADGTQTGAGTPEDPNDGNRSPTNQNYGYPAWHQPGRDGNAVLKPMYFFLNEYVGTSTVINPDFQNSTWTGLAGNCANTDAGRMNCHIQLNRDVYLYNASFNGTSGVGVGILANRPATCTPTPDALDAGHGGVGYWATDQGSWNQSTSNPEGVQFNGADGVLYRCSATNTWTVAYTPYTYPHPLQGQVAEEPAPSRLHPDLHLQRVDIGELALVEP